MKTSTGIVVKVGIADLDLVDAPDKIRTSGLGSCGGGVIYDSFKQIAGVSHGMLPDSTVTRHKNFNHYKYADTAIDILINKLLERQTVTQRLKATLAGGAQMFQHHHSTDITRIGPRNIEAVQERLKTHQIPITAKDVGGTSGRTIEFDPLTNQLKIRTVNKGEVFI